MVRLTLNTVCLHHQTYPSLSALSLIPQQLHTHKPSSYHYPSQHSGAPVTTDNCRVGLAVVRGPSWEKRRRNEDGGAGKGGVVVGWLDAEGEPRGDIPRGLTETAQVRWCENAEKLLYYDIPAVGGDEIGGSASVGVALASRAELRVASGETVKLMRKASSTFGSYHEEEEREEGEEKRVGNKIRLLHGQDLLVSVWGDKGPWEGREKRVCGCVWCVRARARMQGGTCGGG